MRTTAISRADSPADFFRLALLLLALVTPLVASVRGPARKPRTLDKGDKLRTREELVTSKNATYTIEFRGAVDGVMTRDPIGYAAYRQGFQPNVRARIENLGENVVRNPWVTVNGKRSWRTVQDIVHEAAGQYKTERERALAIWYFQQQHRFHACTWDAEVMDPVKMFNVYGYTLCGNDSHVLADLWRTAGLKTRRGFPIGHSTSEAFFDGKYHLLDGDEGIIVLLRDNKTIASEAEIVRDHDLMKRTHSYNILMADKRQRDEFSASLHWYAGERKGDKKSFIKHTMELSLRPREWIEWRWDHAGKQYTAGKSLKPGEKRKNGIGDLLVGWGKLAYDKLRNGKLVYEPNLRAAVSRKGVHSISAANWSKSPSVPAVYPAGPAIGSSVAWAVQSPYVIVGSMVSLEAERGPGDFFAIDYSMDGMNWETLWTAEETGKIRHELVLDDRLSVRRKPQYVYYLRARMKAEERPESVGLHSIRFNTDLQMSTFSLPELVVGKNVVKYRDETGGARKVRITHEWIERASMGPPSAPAEPRFPAHQASVKGTQFTFRWSPSSSDSKIVDYHFQLSEYPDLRWPLSPNFNRLSSKTSGRGKPLFRIPYLGLLNPGQTYYWRVRARSNKQVWGPWSRVWSFQCQAPGVPQDLETEAHPDSGQVFLSWSPNPAGSQPVRYKVYASDEQGFTASDKEYKRLMGRGFCRTLEEYRSKTQANEPNWGMVKTPPNLLGRTESTRIQVVGPGLDHPNANKSFYRVVAIDQYGLESGPSDFVEAPRPFFVSRPVTNARAGQLYEYLAASLASVGHLTCKGGYNAAFWNREEPVFKLIRSPVWLKVNSHHGRLSGTPAQAGNFEIILDATIQEGKTQRTARQNFVLKVLAP